MVLYIPLSQNDVRIFLGTKYLKFLIYLLVDVVVFKT